MANKLYPKTKAKLLQAQLDLSSVTVKAALVENNYVYSDAHAFLSDVPSAYRIAISPALTGVTIGASDASFHSNNPFFSAVTGSSAGEQVSAIILFHDSGSAGSSELVAYMNSGVTGLPFTPNGNDLEIEVPAGGWFSLGGGTVGDPWNHATMVAPPTVAGGTWTTVFDTSSSPTPHFEDFTAGISGVRIRALSTLGNGSGIHLYGAFQPRPGAAYDLIARLRIQKPIFAAYNVYGLMMYESATNKLMLWGWSNVGGIGWYSYWPSGGTPPHNATNWGGADGDNSRLPTTFEGWLKIHDDHAGNLTFYASIDGNYWVTFGSKGYTATAVDFTTAPNYVGFGFESRDSSVSTDLVLDCGSFFAG
jgi:hypothetical protein